MLISAWFMWALVAVTFALGVVSILFERRRRQRFRSGSIGWRRAWIGRLISVTVLVSAVGVTLADRENRQYSYIPSFAALFGKISPNLRPGGLRTVHALQRDPQPVGGHGVVAKVEVPGEISMVSTRPAYVYLPAAYFDSGSRTRRFPVLYMLHGSPGVAADWVRGGQLDQAMERLSLARKISPFIVVMPDVNGGYRRDLECQDVPGGVADESYLAVDVVNFIDHNFRTIHDRRARAIGGLSTGGYCAINIAFRHQDVFSAVVSHSGSGRPDHSRYTGNLFNGNRDLKRANTPDLYLPHLAINHPMAVYLDSGSLDRWSRPETERLRKILATRRLPTEFHIFAGERHSFRSWRSNLSYSLPWASRHFGLMGRSSGPGAAGHSPAKPRTRVCRCRAATTK